MSATLIDQAVGEVLAGINGAPDYTWDLSATGLVVGSRLRRPPPAAGGDRASACFWCASIDEEPAGLPAWSQTGIWMVTLWTPAYPKAPLRRRTAMFSLFDDYRRAFRANPRLRTGGVDQVITLTMSSQPFDETAQAESEAAYGIVLSTLTITWRER